MSKSSYLPTADKGKVIRLNNFVSKFAAAAAQFVRHQKFPSQNSSRLVGMNYALFSLLTFFLCLLPAAYSFSQCGWTQKANFGGTAREYAVGFSIGTKGYIGTGWNGNQDFWEWDQSTNIWTQKANFGGTARNGAVGFSIGTKGYIGTGHDGTYKQDFWEWDQTTNTWTQKANFSGTARLDAVGFSIGTKGYIGTGWNAGFKQDFWEWDQATNVWTQKADFGGTTRQHAVGFSIGTKGYIGTGTNNGGYKQDFWEWDQATDVWIQKANFGGTARESAVGFSIGTKGYIGTGVDVSGYKRDFWEWDQPTNIWTQKANFGGTARILAVGFSIGTKGCIGTGQDPINNFKQDFWEYYVPVLDITSVQNVSCYQGNNGSTTVTVSGITPPYTYLWSNGQTTSVITGLTAGNYTLTVTDVNGCTNTVTAPITQPANYTTIVTTTSSGCNPPNGTATANTSGGVSPYTYLWSDGQNTKTATGLAAGGTYFVTITDSWGCSITGYTTMPALNTPAVYISSVSPVKCYGQCNGSAGGYALGGTPPYHYQWSTVPVQTTATATGLCMGTYNLSVVDNWGCVNINTATANIQQPSSLSLSLSATPTSCGSNNGSIAANVSGGISAYTYNWSNGATTQTASGLSNGSYSVTVADANGCTSTKTDTVHITTAPNPVCLVTVDSTFTKNVIVWEKPASQGAISSFRIYRLISSVFVPIAIVPYSSLSMFVDTSFGVNPQITAYQYEISVIDSCGHESALSMLHQTINLSPPIWNPSPPSFTLYWTDYTGFTFSQYDIYRDAFNTGNWQLIDAVSYILPNQYTDIAAPSDSARYFIQAVHPTGCTPSLKNPVPMSTIKTTKSNTFKTNGTIPTSVNETSFENRVSVEPNPFAETAILRITNPRITNFDLTMFDVFGRAVYSAIIRNSNQFVIRRGNLVAGVYFLQLKTEQGTINKKLILQK